MAIDPNYDLSQAGLRPEEALSPTVELQGAAPLDAEPALRGRGRRRVGFAVAIAWMVVVVFVAFFHTWLPLAPYDEIVGNPKQKPCLCWEEPLGTDAIGRSVASRLAVGARQSLIVGVGSVALAFLVGGMVGVVAGYRRGMTDRAISLMVNAGLAFPALIFLLALAAMLTPSLESITVALAVLFSFQFARLARANTLGVASREFVVASRASGARQSRILVRDIIPNVAVPLISYAFVITAAAMVAEGGLSFLGFGIPPPAPSWGGMIAAGRPALDEDPWLVFIPCLALLFTVLALNSIGEWARRHFEGREIALN